MNGADESTIPRVMPIVAKKKIMVAGYIRRAKITQNAA